nr:lysine-specific demethylase 5D isoform X1 [Tanacetum cinerariifolium]
MAEFEDVLSAWVDEVKAFFSRSTGERSWSLLLQLEGRGSTDAFNCVEMDMVVSEVQRVKEWKRRGGSIIGIKVGDDSMLLDGLSQISDTLDRSLYLHNKPDGCNERNVSTICSA